MDNVKVEVLEVYDHFVANLDDSVNGLYKIKLNNDKAIVFRNGDSWGILSHYLGEPVTKCMGFIRNDRIGIVEQAIRKYLEDDNKKGY